MNDYLSKQIAARKAALAALESRKIVLQAEIAAYEDALMHAGGSGVESPDKPQPNTRPRGRAASPMWSDLFRELKSLGRPFTPTDVDQAAKRKGYSFSPSNIRSQLAVYVGKGTLNRKEAGLFEFTDIPPASAGGSLSLLGD